MKNYFGTHILNEVQIKLISPLIDISFKRGLSLSECLQYIETSGIEIYNKGSVLQCHIRFAKHLKMIYQFSGVKFTKSQSPYNQIYLDFYVKEFIEFLKTSGVHSHLEDLLIEVTDPERDLTTGQYISSYIFNDEDYEKWGLIENLLVKGLSTRMIGIALGLCKSSDSDSIKDSARSRIEHFLKSKYMNFVTEYSIQKLIDFLKSKKL